MNNRRAMLKAFLLPLAAGVAATGTIPAAESAGTWKTALVSVAGLVNGAPEDVSFVGVARVSTRLARDPDFGQPNLIMSFDMSEVTGIGASTLTSYVISGPSIVHRRHAASHSVELTFAFFPAGTSGVTKARTGMGNFVLSVDSASGSVSAVTAAISSPRL